MIEPDEIKGMITRHLNQLNERTSFAETMLINCTNHAPPFRNEHGRGHAEGTLECLEKEKDFLKEILKACQ